MKYKSLTNQMTMKKCLYLFVVACLVACYLALDSNNAKQFSRIEKAYADSTAVNLDTTLQADVLGSVLLSNGYVPTTEDAMFVSTFIMERLKEGVEPESLADLNSRKFQLPAEWIEKEGTATYRQLLEQNYWQSGWSEEAARMATDNSLSAIVQVNDSLAGTMTVKVSHRVQKDSLPRWKAFLGLDKVPAEGVLVRLDRHSMSVERQQLSETVAFGRTDAEGRVQFTGLDPKGSYSVLPLHEGLTFGQSQGTWRGSLAEQQERGTTEFSFVSVPRSVKMFSTLNLRRMRQDGCVTVRTPVMFRTILTSWLAGFLAVWALVFGIGNTGRRRMDNALACLMMGLSGIGMMLMFAINDSLTERLLGVQMAHGAFAGAVAVGCMLCMDWLRFFRGGYRIGFNFLSTLLLFPFHMLQKLGIGRFFGGWVRLLLGKREDEALCPRWLNRGVQSLASLPGSGYLWMAMLLTAALFVFGQSVGGMKVNLFLGIPVQPSEIVKFLFTIFMAAFFFQRGDSLVAYSNPIWIGGRVNAGMLMWRKVKVMAGMLCCLGCLMGMYFRLGDLGPALLISLSFILLYSLVKSRIETGGFLSDWEEVKSCDLARLLVGIVTFVGCLLVGWYMDNTTLPHFWWGCEIEYRAMMAVLWFVVWLVWGFRRHKIEESPLMFNLVIISFIYGSTWLSSMNMTVAAERLDVRTAICTNTFGSLEEGVEAEPAVNAQTATGLWALAMGGMTGQGIGNEGAHHIPAYHTDYIFQSIGFMTGIGGLLVILFMYMALFRRGLVIGYRSGHQFLLFLCTGIVIVTALQVGVVLAGTLGLTPMTGLAAAFLSFGRVSMFFHLLAFGIILSVSARKYSGRVYCNRPYGHTLALLAMVYMFFMTVIVGTLGYYMVLNQDKTLVKQLYVTGDNGLNRIATNPFVGAAIRNMRSGDVWDRNGVLLATSDATKLKDKQQADAYAKAGLADVDSISRRLLKRYYPFGKHLAFTLGDANNGLFFNSVDSWPHGLLCEARYLTQLRGYDNIMRDGNGVPVQVDLHSEAYKPGRFVEGVDTVIRNVQLRDYSPILPFVKAGPDSELVERFNQGKTELKPNDIQLTVDAVLQTRLQEAMAGWEYSFGTNRYGFIERRSVVVLDASQGDLLASANYPLMEEERVLAEGGIYNDSHRPLDWKAYADVDMGLLLGTAPGSTAKIMTGLAGVAYADAAGISINGKDFTYPVNWAEQIHTNSRAVGMVNFHDAIMWSSNCYFINLLNDHNLYDELADIYGTVGVSTGREMPYGLDWRMPEEEWRNRITAVAPKATDRYHKYQEMRGKGDYRKMNDNRITHAAWQWSWGQGLNATPVSMARVAAVVADGSMPVTRFRMDQKPEKVRLVSPDGNLRYLRKAMRDESLKLGAGTRMSRAGVFGKSGTAERVYSGPLANKGQSPVKVNDAWYISCIPDCRITRMVNGKQLVTTGPIAVCVRIERTSQMSGAAKLMTEEVVLKTLAELGYIPALTQ